jgi:hypothetical protein
MALGALLIQTRLRATDEETVMQISENTYLQYFIGLHEYQTKPPFDPSMMVYFRKRITPETIAWINEEIRRKHGERNTPKDPPDDHSGTACDKNIDESIENKGKLILDATCAPQDIRYPTDISLLNEAREKLEGMIDRVWEQVTVKVKKPRTYRERARRDFLRFIKRRKPSRKKIRSAIRAQLGYVNRDLRIINQLLIQWGIDCLSDTQIEQLITIHRLYAQQQEMYATGTHRVDQRIVSILQPHVRPIVRGKAGCDTEFGAKILVSMVNGHATIERLSWENFNEGCDLIECVKSYRERYGFYPKAVLADKLFRTRDNLSFCKTHGIRLSGPPLGRPKAKDVGQSDKIQRKDNGDRNAIEGKFGQGKRRYGLGCIMTKRKHTSEVSIHLQFLVMNLTHYLRLLLSYLAKTPAFRAFLQFLFARLQSLSFF